MFMIYADNKLIYQPSSEKLQLLSPKLTLEIGKAGSLDFGVPPTHTYYNNFQQLKSVLINGILQTCAKYMAKEISPI